MTDPTPAPEGAYELLTRPVQIWTDAEVERICVDLRLKRQRFLQGTQDNAAKPRKSAAPVSKEQKQANTDALMAAMLSGLK